MRICLLDTTATMTTITPTNNKNQKQLLQLVKTSAPPLGPMPVKRTRAVTIVEVVVVKNLWSLIRPD